MEIRDELLDKSIDSLFQYPIIVYGAGWDGKKVKWLLEMAHLHIECFVDKDSNKKIEGYQVLSPEQLKEHMREITYNVILSSSLYYMDMFKDLKEYVDVHYVYTGRAVEEAIIKKFDDSRFPIGIKEEYLNRWHIWGRDKRKAELASNSNIMLWIPPKVGSTTVKFTLNKYGVQVIHIHNVQEKSEIEKKVSSPLLKVICLVREPIARDLSYFMESKVALMAGDKNDINEYMLKCSEKDLQFSFYNDQIKKYLGIDVYQYAFNREQGYGIIEKGNVKILILKLEKLEQNVDILGSFVGIRNLELVRGNEGNKKPYRDEYSQIKEEYRIPQIVIERYYRGNKRMDHFYTESEKNVFLQKYQCRII